jgi:hypothetical protein
MSQLTVRRDQRDLIRCIRSQVNEHIVTAASGMDDRHAVNEASLDSVASFSF